MATIGIIGSGHVGDNLAKAAVAHGYHVVLSNSQGPDSLVGLVTRLGPMARAATPEEAAATGDFAIVGRRPPEGRPEATGAGPGRGWPGGQAARRPPLRRVGVRRIGPGRPGRELASGPRPGRVCHTAEPRRA
jgi:hypothetical protein